jgi:hypothetical protein
MRINGEWLLCDDGVVRPIVRGQIETADGDWFPCEFLADVGADRTVLTATVVSFLGFELVKSGQLGGWGGNAPMAEIETRIRLGSQDGRQALFRGKFAAAIDDDTLDIAILGRDITNLFAVVVDQPGDTVCFLRGNDGYRIVQGGD